MQASQAETDGLRRWPAAAATGVGSMPGTDVLATARTVRDELAQDGCVPFLAELPSRGPGADMIGRALGVLAGVWPAWSAQTTPTGWRLADGPGRDSRRAVSYLTQDLDVLAEVYEGWRGPLVVPLAGPWTLAATVELASGERVVRDRGATRDLVQAWGHGAGSYLEQVRRRLPRATPVVQADEPALPAVLGGAVPTASGLLRHRAVEPADVRDGLRAAREHLADGQGELLVHCCAAEVPFSLLREAGVAGIGVDLARCRSAAAEQGLGECIDAGLRMALGVVPRGGPVSEVAASVAAVTSLAARLGFPLDVFARASAICSPCGLADLSPAGAAGALHRARETGRALREEQPA